MIIRPAKIIDFLEIAALDRVAWQTNSNADFIPDGEHAWRVWVEHALVFCAEADRSLTGIILAFPTTNDSYCLHKLFVFQEARGSGIAGKLMTSLLKEIDKIQVDIFLTVDPENKTAVALYKNWGFTDQQFVKGYYRENEDRLVLTRPLYKRG